MDFRTEQVVCVDCGHGGSDPGAVHSMWGTREKDVTLKVGLLLMRMLVANGVPVITTRADDRFLSLSERAAIANKKKAILISIHCNASQTHKGHGFECFTSPGQTESDRWATLALEDHHEEFPDRALRRDLRDGDPDKEARFTVLTKTAREAILFELGFIDNDQGSNFLTDEDKQVRMAESLCRATLRFLGIEEKFWTPNLLRNVTPPSPNNFIAAGGLPATVETASDVLMRSMPDADVERVVAGMRATATTLEAEAGELRENADRLEVGE